MTEEVSAVAIETELGEEGGVGSMVDDPERAGAQMQAEWMKVVQVVSRTNEVQFSCVAFGIDADELAARSGLSERAHDCIPSASMLCVP